MTVRPSAARPARADRAGVTAPGFGGASIGGLCDRRRRRPSARDRPPRVGPRRPPVRHGAAVRLRRVRAADGRGPRRSAARRLRPLDESRPARPRRSTAIPPGADVDHQALDGADDAFYVRHEPVRVVFDYSADGVRRSIEESLGRLGLERIDIALIHDPDDHWQAAIDEAYPALARLRDEGVIRAIGAGMNQSSMLARFAREGDFDVVPARRPLHAPRPGARSTSCCPRVRRAGRRACSSAG